MKKLLLSLALIFTFFATKANDGAFYSEGNHLIPIVETDISVQKEILTVTRRHTKSYHFAKYYVTVYYEFFNPGEDKDLLVGFEALPPSEGFGSPDIFDFKVIMNGDSLDYQVSAVPKGDYYIDGQFQQCITEVTLEEEYWDPCLYVYHFDAHFTKGVNIIQHTYVFNGSDDNLCEFVFDYVLTAANRWANNGIDDFTLILDMGDRESFFIEPRFFNDANDFTCEGKGIITTASRWKESYPIYHIQEGKIVFHKTNFHPDGELWIIKHNYDLYNFKFNSSLKKYIREFLNDDDMLETIKKQYFNFEKLCSDLHINDNQDSNQLEGKSSLSDDTKRILRNLPFAYRGYVFKNKDLQNFFESTEWYIPNPDYKENIDEMSPDEKNWIEFWKN